MRCSQTPSAIGRLLCRLALVVTLSNWGLYAGAQAHEIPNDVQVQSFLKQEEQGLTLFIRVPLSSMKEVELPLLNNLYLDIPHIKPALQQAADLWFVDNLKIVQGQQSLNRVSVKTARISLPSNRSFVTYETALAHVRSENWELPSQLVWNQQYLDLELQVNAKNDDSNIEIDFGLQRLAQRVAIDLRFQLLNAQERAFEFNAREGAVLLNPSAWQASWRFIQMGFKHILSGTDHLLFIACLILTATQWLSLVGVITGFTLAHSLTLIAAAMGYAPAGLWFLPWVELAIAFSIVYLALENIWRTDVRRRWLVCTLFGLIHGFGFSFALHESMQFAGTHHVLSLLSFNLGVEAGQLLVLLLGVPVAMWLATKAYARTLTIVLSALIAHLAWHWMEERWVIAAKFLPAYF
ncbi:MAG: HupE/UreJ family protein [Betaproteobacteria bacterium]|nr:HupE/UreJ family protein [Betaproteobacteria bacterium]